MSLGRLKDLNLDTSWHKFKCSELSKAFSVWVCGCVCVRRLIQHVVLQCGLRVFVMRMEPHKGCFSSEGSWQGNDLMDIRVTVFWPGLNLTGALMLTVSLSGTYTDHKIQQTSRRDWEFLAFFPSPNPFFFSLIISDMEKHGSSMRWAFGGLKQLFKIQHL